MMGGGGWEDELNRILAIRLLSEEKTDEVDEVSPLLWDCLRLSRDMGSLETDLARGLANDLWSGGMEPRESGDMQLSACRLVADDFRFNAFIDFLNCVVQ